MPMNEPYENIPHEHSWFSFIYVTTQHPDVTFSLEMLVAKPLTYVMCYSLGMMQTQVC